MVFDYRAIIADIWDAGKRGKAMAIFTLGPFAGPALGPTIGGFIGDNTSWRWLFWVMAGFVGVSSHDLYIRPILSPRVFTRLQVASC